MTQTTLRLTVAAALIASVGIIGCHRGPKPAELVPPNTVTPTEVPPQRIEAPSAPVLTPPPIGEPELSSPLLDVYFDFDRYELRADQRATLEANASWLLANPDARVSVEGHCDERGTDEYNFALGDRRAKAAASYLRTRGVPDSRIQTISYGEAYPVDPGHAESSWWKNRRAHFVVVGTR